MQERKNNPLHLIHDVLGEFYFLIVRLLYSGIMIAETLFFIVVQILDIPVLIRYSVRRLYGCVVVDVGFVVYWWWWWRR